jgi:hypothetical protein
MVFARVHCQNMIWLMSTAKSGVLPEHSLSIKIFFVFSVKSTGKWDKRNIEMRNAMVENQCRLIQSLMLELAIRGYKPKIQCLGRTISSCACLGCSTMFSSNHSKPASVPLLNFMNYNQPP